MAKAIVPMSVSERFAPAERPNFKLLRLVGPCGLWRSKTVAHQSHGNLRPARVHYHVTTGEEADHIFMPVFDTAVRCLVLSVQAAKL